MNFTPNTFVKPLNGYTIATVTSNGATTGPIIDTLGWDYAVIVLNAGTFTSSASLAFKATESADSGMSGAADISGAAFTAVTTSNDEAIFAGRVYLQPRLRYLQLSATHSGTGNAVFGATVLLMKCEESALQSVTYAFSVG